MDYLFLPPFIIPNPMQYSTADVTVTPPFSSISELLNFNRRDFDRECCLSRRDHGRRRGSAAGRDVAEVLAFDADDARDSRTGLPTAGAAAGNGAIVAATPPPPPG